MKHFGEFKDTKDKIIHLLFAAKIEGLYGLAIVECVKKYGEEETSLAVNEFKTYYMN